MSDKRDKVRDRIIEINNTCVDVTKDPERSCSNSCPYYCACTFLLAFDEWRQMQSHRKAGDEDLERLVDSVMTIEDYEDLLEVEI